MTMDGINTAEQFLLAEYEKLKQENDNLQAQMKSLADELDVIVESADFADDEQLADLANRIRKLAKTDDIDVAGLRKQDAREHEQRHIHGGCEHL